MGNAYLPARAGELLRSAFLGQKKRAWNQLHPCDCLGGADTGCNRAGADRIHPYPCSGWEKTIIIDLAGDMSFLHGAGRPIGAGHHHRRAVPGKIDSEPVFMAAAACKKYPIFL